jgi:hypothetical protein
VSGPDGETLALVCWESAKHFDRDENPGRAPADSDEARLLEEVFWKKSSGRSLLEELFTQCSFFGTVELL